MGRSPYDRRVVLGARRLLAAAAALMVLASSSAAGEVADSTIPVNAVARVGEDAVKYSTFRHWLNIAAVSGQRGPRIYYHPPGFTSCVKLKRKVTRASRAQRKIQCQTEYEGLRDQVLQFLILERWVAGEAAARGVALTAGEAETAFQEVKRDTFPKESDFRRFLRRSGMTAADARFQIAFNALYTKLRELAIAAAPAVTKEEVDAYYREHKEQFGQPELRDLLVVLTKTRARADAARAALERGQSFRQVAPRYSIDQTSRLNGGRVLGVAEGSQEEAFDKALFRAPPGRLQGPIKVPFGYYVFKVVKITRAKQQTLAQARPAIREQLTVERRRQADDTFNTELRTTWRARTTCRTGFLVEQCGNGPLPEPEEPDFE